MESELTNDVGWLPMISDANHGLILVVVRLFFLRVAKLYSLYCALLANKCPILLHVQ